MGKFWVLHLQIPETLAMVGSQQCHASIGNRLTSLSIFHLYLILENLALYWRESGLVHNKVEFSNLND